MKIKHGLLAALSIGAIIGAFYYGRKKGKESQGDEDEVAAKAQIASAALSGETAQQMFDKYYKGENPQDAIKDFMKSSFDGSNLKDIIRRGKTRKTNVGNIK